MPYSLARDQFDDYADPWPMRVTAAVLATHTEPGTAPALRGLEHILALELASRIPWPASVTQSHTLSQFTGRPTSDGAR